MREVLKKFGRYILLDQVAQGGMAEIYRARLASRDGAGRILAIKRIQTSFGSNTEFLAMFKSEIKVTMGLSHPNIAQLFDFGTEESLPYIAMEFVDGKNLRQFMARFSELRMAFPIEIAAYITEQAACGLHYAHSYKDKITGDPLNIIHRDISPQNVLISYEGNVKIIDFGIAKATVNKEDTRAGVIKGKPSYLSPEQISGDPLDGRCDVFALGTVLWELLAGKKLFSGENDLAVLKLIESAHTYVKPPSTVNPKVPKELDYIVLKALAKQPDKRYQTAGEFQRALHKFIYSYMPDFDPSSLGYYAKDLFKNEIVEDRKLIQRLNDKVELLLFGGHDEGSGDLLMQEVSKKTEKPAGKEEKDTTTALEPIQKSTGAREAFHPDAINNNDVQIELSKMLPSRGSRSGIPSEAQSNRPSSSQPAAAIPARSAGAASRSSVPSQRRSSQYPQGGLDFGRLAVFMAAAVAALAVLGPKLGIVKVPEIPMMPGVAEFFGLGETKLVLEGNYRDVVVRVDDQEIARGLPATLTGIPAGKQVTVEVSGKQGAFKQELALGKGEKRTLLVMLAPPRVLAANERPAAEPQKTVLRLNLTAVDHAPLSGAFIVTLNNQPLKVDSPIATVPLDSPLLLIIDGARYRRLEREFSVSARDIVNGEYVMNVELEPLRFGRLTVRTYPSSATAIIIGSDGKRWEKEAPFEAMEFPVGSYEIHLKSLVYDEKVIRGVRIEEGKLIKVVEQLEIKN